MKTVLPLIGSWFPALVIAVCVAGLAGCASSIGAAKRPAGSRSATANVTQYTGLGSMAGGPSNSGNSSIPTYTSSRQAGLAAPLTERLDAMDAKLPRPNPDWKGQ